MLNLGQRPSGPAAGLPSPAWAGIATCTLSATTAGVAPGTTDRPPHHTLMLTSVGHGTVEVDFTVQACRPGTLLWIRPGQAVRFGSQPGHDATIITWNREAQPTGENLSPLLDEPFGPVRWQLAGEDEDAVISEFTQLAVDGKRYHTGTLAAALLRHQLAVLLLRLALLAEPVRPAISDAEAKTFARFRRELERGHPESRRVEDYAAALGCSVRTLTRASLSLTGRTAKQVVDDRVALEAKRLLACTSVSVAEIGRRLGFPEPTNFGRFFHREVGESPGAFRAALSRAAPPHIPNQRRAPDSR